MTTHLGAFMLTILTINDTKVLAKHTGGHDTSSSAPGGTAVGDRMIITSPFSLSGFTQTGVIYNEDGKKA